MRKVLLTLAVLLVTVYVHAQQNRYEITFLHSYATSSYNEIKDLMEEADDMIDNDPSIPYYYLKKLSNAEIGMSNGCRLALRSEYSISPGDMYSAYIYVNGSYEAQYVMIILVTEDYLLYSHVYKRTKVK